MSLQEVFQEISAADFFYRNRDIAGFTNPTRAIYSTIRELVENSLDACEIRGIPPEHIPQAFSRVRADRRAGNISSSHRRQRNRNTARHHSISVRPSALRLEVQIATNPRNFRTGWKDGDSLWSNNYTWSGDNNVEYWTNQDPPI